MRRAGAVVFDCDSTLAAIEGIEFLARGHREEIERLTDAAMRGELALEAVYGRRLALVKPSRADIARLGAAYVEALVPDAREVVAALKAEGVAVRVLSGGVRDAVAHVAREIGVHDDDVEAVGLVYDERGGYAGFDEASPLARAGGKADVVQAWRDRLPAPVMLVGDGATDLEAADAVETFVAYAGVIERPEVTAGADVVVRSPSLAPVLAIALAGEPPHDPAHRPTFERGMALLDDETRRRLPLERDDRG